MMKRRNRIEYIRIVVIFCIVLPFMCIVFVVFLFFTPEIAVWYIIFVVFLFLPSNRLFLFFRFHDDINIS